LAASARVRINEAMSDASPWQPTKYNESYLSLNPDLLIDGQSSPSNGTLGPTPDRIRCNVT
jgi:hypothetical protein